MNLNLTEVLLQEGKLLEREVPLDLDILEYSFGTFPVREKGLVRISARQDKEKVLNLHGEVTLKVEIPCDRCLDPVEVSMPLAFDERVKLSGESSESDPAEEDADSEEGSFDKDYLIQGYNLDVDKLVSGEALLSWPSRVLCSEDCKGLCPICGHNLNRSECGCDRRQLDPRMASVLDVGNLVNKEV